MLMAIFFSFFYLLWWWLLLLSSLMSFYVCVFISHFYFMCCLVVPMGCCKFNVIVQYNDISLNLNWHWARTQWIEHIIRYHNVRSCRTPMFDYLGVRNLVDFTLYFNRFMWNINRIPFLINIYVLIKFVCHSINHRFRSTIRLNITLALEWTIRSLDTIAAFNWSRI